ncbi:MAG: hypothetical protein DRG71_02010 [Deltaproteobacteria bacterium]|nr:MAG: hypothetical protein DRG71_02010 [Deltaproteobacteria bacterium]HDG97033.1 hypothetical protein [Desulfobacterales bacterium]
MPVKLKDKRIRRTALALALLATLVLVWWAKVYAPLKERKYSLQTELTRLSVEHRKLQKQLKRLSKAISEQGMAQRRLRQLSRMTVKAASIEEANAMIQAKMQHFFEGHDIQLNAYKELPPGKWGPYQVGRVEFRLYCTTKRLAELLQYVNRLEAGIRVDKLEISSRIRVRRRTDRLRVTLRLASLFAQGNEKSAQS